MNALHELVQSIENNEMLGRIAKPAQRAIGKATSARPVRNLLSGTFVGHPVHPVLTDIPIGAWGAAVALDLTGSEKLQPAVDPLLAAGIAAAVPTALTGLNDWSQTGNKSARVGIVHAAANSAALACFGGALAARRAGAIGMGRALGVAGLGLMGAGGYLGGHLAFAQGVGVNHALSGELPADWITVAPLSALAQDRGVFQVQDTEVLIVRVAGDFHALAADCPHQGGPLQRGDIKDGCISCPWHDSKFRLADGSVVRGPATTPVPVYDVQVVDDQIQVKQRVR